MKNLYKQKREQGFTIIEVMIVLAIAAVILLIVLLAVPALQRNSRNTQRANDGGQIAAAVNSCLANQSGVPTNCQTIGVSAVDIQVAGGIATKLGQLSTQPTYSATAAGFTISKGVWTFKYDCGGGNTPTANTNPKSFIVVYQVETTGAAQTHCVEG